MLTKQTLPNMKPYSTYKHSGIEWIGEIPEHWEIVRMKYLCDIGTGDKDTENAEDDGEYPFFVRSQTIERISSYTFDGEAILTAGDGVGVCKVWHYLNGKFDYHQRVYRMSDFDGVIGKFLYYYLKQNFVLEVKKLSAKSTVDSLRRPMFQNFQIAIGTLEEQTTIANYLDRKTEEIDTLIAQKKQLITLYKEERTATINQAVTKGLDPNVPMKDSGIEWLGDIPEHWEVGKLKFVCSMKSGNNIVSEQINESGRYPVYGGNGLRGYFDEYTHSGDHILIGRQGALCGNINYAQGEFWASEHAVVCEQLLGHDWIWLGELLASMNLNQYSQASAQPGLAVEKIKNLQIPIPDIDVSKKIGRFIKSFKQEFENKISKTEQEIELLKEYKTALISEVVLGKVDVREEVLIG